MLLFLISCGLTRSRIDIHAYLRFNDFNGFNHMSTCLALISLSLMHVTRKQTLRSQSLSYQKKDGHAWPRPPFFWYDTYFSEFDSAAIIDYILEKSVSCQKKDGRGHARRSFFWYDNDKDLKVCFLVTCVTCLTLISLSLCYSQGFTSQQLLTTSRMLTHHCPGYLIWTSLRLVLLD